MLETQVTIQNKAGLHARPSSMIVKVASNYPCEVYIGTENNMINAKSIMGVMTLGAGYKNRINCAGRWRGRKRSNRKNCRII